MSDLGFEVILLFCLCSWLQALLKEVDDGTGEISIDKVVNVVLQK